MQMLGGGMILCGCLGLGMWYRGQFLMRLHMTRELICLLDQWISEIRYNRSTLPEGCRQIGRLGEICNRVYREYAEAGGTGFLEIAGESFRRQLEALPLKKEEIDQFLIFAGKEGYADETMQIRAMELSKEGLERTATAGNYAEMSAGGRTGCYEWDVFGAPVALKDKKQDKKGRGKMEIGLIFKIAAVGILVTILSQVLKHSGREEHAFLISLAGLILVLSWIVPYIYDLFDTVQTLFSF